MTLAALIPAYREERYIGDVVRAVRQQVDLVYVVDDGSGDATARRAAEAGAQVITHRENLGKGAALKTGFRHLAKKNVDWIIVLDGDGQHLAEEIPRFRAAAEQDPSIHVWLGNRMSEARAMPLVRRLTNRFMSWLLSRVCGQRIPDSQCGFRLLQRGVLPKLDCESTAFDYESEMLIRLSRAGECVGAVPITTVYRDEVSSIRPARDTLRFARLIWRNWRRPAPPRNAATAAVVEPRNG